jgi:hypothetical protein
MLLRSDAMLRIMMLPFGQLWYQSSNALLQNCNRAFL